MSAFLEMLLPTGILVHCLNAAVASFVVCTISVILSRRSSWSLPLRHALLVAGLAVGLIVPLAFPICPLPVVWAIGVSDSTGRPPPSPRSEPIGNIHHVAHPIAQDKTSVPVAGTRSTGVQVAMTVNVPPFTGVSKSVPAAPMREQPAITTPPWFQFVGTLLCGIWLVGILVMLGRTILGLAKLRLWMQTISIIESPAIDAAARLAAQEVGLRSQVTIYHSAVLPAPVTCGLVRQRIVMPVDIEADLSFDQLRAVIQHEMAHIARRDLWIGLLQQAASIVYWWNPLVCLANHQLADLREQICDDIAIGELPDPRVYAATLISLTERYSQCAPIPATLGIGSSPTSQLETRIRRILSPSDQQCTQLSRWSLASALAIGFLMTATILLAQVQLKPTDQVPSQDLPNVVPSDNPDNRPLAVPVNTQNPTLQDLIQQMAVYERMYFPFDIQAMETFHFPDDLTPQERSKNLRADGRKHQRLTEYAQLIRRIWRSKATGLIDDDVQQGPSERFSDAKRIIHRSPNSGIKDANQVLEFYIDNRENAISNYLFARPLGGVFCLSAFSAGELFSDAFKNNEQAIELTWDNGDAKLSFGYGKPHWNTRYVLWLSHVHNWHPIRLQRFWNAEDKLFHDEWEVTKFVQHRKDWRIAEGTHRYREHNGREIVDPKIKYSMDFKILATRYGDDVEAKQFEVEIPAGATVRERDKPDAVPIVLTKPRAFKVTIVDVVNQPIPNATVRLPANLTLDYDVVVTDKQGVAKSMKAPEGNVSLEITAEGFRPVTWVVGGGNELRAVMTPRTSGSVLDQGKPVAEVWITSGALQIRADGYTYVPERNRNDRGDWTDAEGRFLLTSNLTVRTADAVVPLIAVDPSRDKMAIRFVKAGELGQQQDLALQNTCHVTGHCLLTEMTDTVDVDISVTTIEERDIGFLSTRKVVTKEGLRVDFQLRMPPGDYLLKSRQTAHHASFTIPLTIAPGEAALDMGTKSIPLAGSVSLKGKLAPELKLRWRPGQEQTWETLRGKIVVLDFWGTWCVPCVADMPELMDVAEQFRDKPVYWLLVHTPNVETFAELDRAIAICQEKSWNKRNIPFTTVIDTPVDEPDSSGQTGSSYSVVEWPTLIVVDQSGKVVGPISKIKLAATITQLLERGPEK